MRAALVRTQIETPQKDRQSASYACRTAQPCSRLAPIGKEWVSQRGPVPRLKKDVRAARLNPKVAVSSRRVIWSVSSVKCHHACGLTRIQIN